MKQGMFINMLGRDTIVILFVSWFLLPFIMQMVISVAKLQKCKALSLECDNWMPRDMLHGRWKWFSLGMMVLVNTEAALRRVGRWGRLGKTAAPCRSSPCQ